MRDSGPTRRAVLAAAALAGARLILGTGCARDDARAPAPDVQAPGAPPAAVQTGGLVRLPDRGTLFAASDFHARHADFRAWLRRTRLAERLRSEEDVYGLILGDAVDVKPGDAEADPEGDRKIVDEILAIRAGPGGGRLVVLRGNHEHEVARAWTMLEEREGLDEGNRKALVAQLFAGDQGAYFRQFNFLERVTAEQVRFLRGLPVLAVAARGVVGAHAGPARACDDLAGVVEEDGDAVEDLVWSRPRGVRSDGYALEDVERFLGLAEGSVLLTGHTPLGSLPAEWLRHGVGFFGPRQLVLATSFGSESGTKSYLELDLAARYANAEALRPGREILPLG